ncbi:MAG: signal peptidase I [Bacteroidota bacterium]|nr:signal peptidase I [Bacteroidota bacterium]
MNWKSYTKWIAWILLLFFLIRVFGVQIEKVQDHSMSSTILPKDRVIITKLRSGLRFPNSVLGLPGSDRSFIDAFRIPYFRLPAISKYKVGSIIAFNDPRIFDKPIDRKPLSISRIAALPGDTLIIWDKNHYCNSELISPPVKARRIYRVVTDGVEIPNDFLKEFYIEPPTMIANIGIWDVNLDTIAYQELSKQAHIKTIRTTRVFAGASSSDYWPYSGYYLWNRDQMGPLIVPYQGQRIEIDIKTIDQYKSLIENSEGNEIIIDYTGVIRINGQEVKEYTIKKNYYFILDDNRDNPNDSRIIGYIPEDHILGVIYRSLWSPYSKSILSSVK